jgi:hypothetical protein
VGWRDFGLVKFDAVWLWIGVQCWAFYFLALTWYHRSMYDSSQAGINEDQPEVSNDSDSHQLQIVTHDAQPVEEQPKKLHQSTITIKSESGVFANMLSEERMDKGKRAFEAFMQWILENSYKLSLAGLYMASLSSVNLIKAGYCKRYNISFFFELTDGSDYIHFVCGLSKAGETILVRTSVVLLRRDIAHLRVELLLDCRH